MLDPLFCYERPLPNSFISFTKIFEDPRKLLLTLLTRYLTSFSVRGRGRRANLEWSQRHEDLNWVNRVSTKAFGNLSWLCKLLSEVIIWVSSLYVAVHEEDAGPCQMSLLVDIFDELYLRGHVSPEAITLEKLKPRVYLSKTKIFVSECEKVFGRVHILPFNYSLITINLVSIVTFDIKGHRQDS